MGLSKELNDKYTKAIIKHFIKNGYSLRPANIKRAILDIVYFLDCYESLEACLKGLYPHLKI